MVFALDMDDGGLLVFPSTAEAVAHCKGVDVEDGFWRLFAEDGSPLAARIERQGDVAGAYTLERAMSGRWLQELLPQVMTVKGCDLNTVVQLAETLEENRK